MKLNFHIFEIGVRSGISGLRLMFRTPVRCVRTDFGQFLFNKMLLFSEVLKTVFRKGSQVEVEEFEKPVEENLVKLKRAEVPLTPEKIKLMESLQIVEKFKATDEIQVTVKIKRFKGKIRKI